MVRTMGSTSDFLTADSINLVNICQSARVGNSLFLEGHLTSARKPIESPTSANERPKRKTQRRLDFKLHKLVARTFLVEQQKASSTTRATDKVFGISCNSLRERGPARATYAFELMDDRVGEGLSHNLSSMVLGLLSSNIVLVLDAS